MTKKEIKGIQREQSSNMFLKLNRSSIDIAKPESVRAQKIHLERMQLKEQNSYNVFSTD